MVTFALDVGGIGAWNGPKHREHNQEFDIDFGS